jgi:hypothetical protein
MALTKQTITDKIEIVGQFNALQIRQAKQILEDGEVISSSFHRYVLQPDADVSAEDAKIQAVAAAVWTDEVKAAYATHLAVQQQELNNG